ncbi:MAG: nucleoside:proton symporter [Rickettsiales bacterium]|nr:nucleoside:proton symporter [Rickettsiales bacterium]|tara:strand:+ start:1807 stop:3051 length:1245 start_codon:yes stop_codon:yes gene_type:complete
MLQGLLGIAVILIVSRLFCDNNKLVRYGPVLKAFLIQVLLAFIILHFHAVQNVVDHIGNGLTALRNATLAGTSFVFGYLGGNPCPFAITPKSSTFIFAFQALPLVIVVSALAMLLFHWRVLPFFVKILSRFFQPLLGIGGALGTCSAAKLFLSQTETPLLIKPYINKLSKGELFSLMTLGMATTSGSVLVIYALILGEHVPNVMMHLISASLINIPGAIVISRLMVPHDLKPTDGTATQPYEFQNSLDAVYEGTSQGLNLFLNIIAAIIVFIALIYLTNSILQSIGNLFDIKISLQIILGLIFKPLVWLMGVPWEETTQAGAILGLKTIINEMVAFEAFSKVPADALSTNARIIMAYALCGFANLSSIGIQIATLGTIAKDRRSQVISLGFRALIAGTLASCLSGTIVGLLMLL